MACITRLCCRCPTRPRGLTHSFAGFQVNETTPYLQNKVGVWVSHFRVHPAGCQVRVMCWCWWRHAVPLGGRPLSRVGECPSPPASPHRTAGTGSTTERPLADRHKMPWCTTAAWLHSASRAATAWRRNGCRLAVSPLNGQPRVPGSGGPLTAAEPFAGVAVVDARSVLRLRVAAPRIPGHPKARPLAGRPLRALGPCVGQTGCWFG